MPLSIPIRQNDQQSAADNQRLIGIFSVGFDDNLVATHSAKHHHIHDAFAITLATIMAMDDSAPKRIAASVSFMAARA